ncbi:MAG: modification methylase, HemK family [Dehalococcoidia bacterium]|nr:modification methylase, HemK family [Dehalococcoidia bacterium]
MLSPPTTRRMSWKGNGCRAVKIGQVLQETRKELSHQGGDEVAIEAEVLLMSAMGIGRASLYASLNNEISSETVEALRDLVERRVRMEPLAYITGHKEFYGLDFYVDQRVLVPRPETELLVEEVLNYVHRRSKDGVEIRDLADIGTGSGAIAICLALHCPGASVYATDISLEALEVAAINCNRHGVADRVQLIPGYLLDPLPDAVDIIVADLPYVDEADLIGAQGIGNSLGLWVGEPIVALSGGTRGLDIIGRFLQEAPRKLRPGGAIFLEMAWNQGSLVTDMAQKLYPGTELVLSKDLAGHDRIFSIMTKNEGR